jgi:hypothetical protein
VAVLLSVPCFSWPFLWDDFDFLARAMKFQFRNLLPDSAVALYRPLSREVYFGILQHAAGGWILTAHVLNAAVAAGSVYLLMALLRKWNGARAGVIGSLMLASAAAIPFLVGWISGIQDLLCILLILAAYHSFSSGHLLRGTAAFAGAILSKEIAVAIAPATVVLASIPEPRSRGRILRAALCVAIVVLAWALLHPWTHRLLTGHAAGSLNEYVAFRGKDTLRGAVRGFPSLLNVSWSPFHAWSASMLLTGAAASVLAVLGVRSVSSRSFDPASAPGARDRLIAYAGILTLLGPFLLTSAFLAHWSPYYAGASTIGLAMLIAPPLSRARWPLAAAVVVAFLWIGISSRAAILQPEIPAETNLRVTADAMRRIETGFKSLRATLPRHSAVYAYVQAQGRSGAYLSLYRNQPLKIWYGDPSLEVRDPLNLSRTAAEEFLFWVSPELEVFEVNPSTLSPRSSGAPIPLRAYQKTLRAFALGLSGRGEVARAVSILTTMPQDSGADLAYDRRSAAAILFASGRDREAQALVSTTAHFHRGQAIVEVGGLIAKPIPGIDLDEGALRAFDFAPNDSAAVRAIMRWLAERNYWSSADRFAWRLLSLVPGEPEASGILRRGRQPASLPITTRPER